MCCQVIVKLPNIVLTPDEPEYYGCDWLVEGIHNEHIIAVGVYYYDASNVSEAQLHFRQEVCVSGLTAWDRESVRAIFGLREGLALNQLLGTVATKSDRCIVFPNVLRHRLSPFHLLDPSRGGVLRSLVFLLVDPSVRIASTANVPPQQRAWVEREVLSSVRGLQCLPEVLVREVMDYVGGITPAQARAHRETLARVHESMSRKWSRTPSSW